MSYSYFTDNELKETQNESNLHNGKVKHDAWWFSG